MKKLHHLILFLMTLLLVTCEPEQPLPTGIAPVASFTASTVETTVGQSILFSDESINTPTSWNWNFGDGSTSTLQNPSHTYNNTGVFTVTLTATNSFGEDSETKTNYITINPAGGAPVAAFTGSPRTITTGQSVQFTDQSSNTPTGWNWNFGDGSTSTLQNPSHTYNNAGVYTVTLSASNSFGNDPEVKTNYITVNSAGSAPVAAFTASPTTIATGQSVQFTDQSANTPTSWNWNFGDGGTSTSQNPSHTYNGAGIYTVILTVSNSFGTDELEKVNYISASAFIDTRDGHAYTWVQIGNQIWMAENLAYLPSVSPPSVGSNTSSYYYVIGYEGSSISAAKATSNYTTYGVLYNWYAAMNGASSSSSNPSGVQGVCPSGWHLPSGSEWNELTDHLGGEAIAGGKMKEPGLIHWEDPNVDASNESGFTGLPGGYRNKTGGIFSNFGTYAMFWSTTEYISTDAWGRGLYNGDAQVYNYNYYKEHGFSVRCIKND